AQGLADPLHDAAMRLTIDQKLVDDDPEVIDEGVFYHLGPSGVRINLDLGNVAAIRESGGRAVINIRDIQALRQIGRQLQAGMDPAGQLHNADRPVGTGNHEPARTELNVGHRGLKYMRGDLPTGLDHLFAGADNRVATDDHRLRASSTAAGDQLI